MLWRVLDRVHDQLRLGLCVVWFLYMSVCLSILCQARFKRKRLELYVCAHGSRLACIDPEVKTSELKVRQGYLLHIQHGSAGRYDCTFSLFMSAL